MANPSKHQLVLAIAAAVAMTVIVLGASRAHSRGEDSLSPAQFHALMRGQGPFRLPLNSNPVQAYCVNHVLAPRASQGEHIKLQAIKDAAHACGEMGHRRHDST